MLALRTEILCNSLVLEIPKLSALKKEKMPPMRAMANP
jgi:hypothetical protein